MLSRRHLLGAMISTLPAWGHETSLASLEKSGRLGVAALDTGNGRKLNHRAGERFAMCSTFKLVLASAILKRIDDASENFSRLIRYSKSDVVSWSPVTGEKTALDVRSLLEAILLVSDNTAANLLLATIGGPAGWTAFARGLGDTISRLDRIETELNSAIPGDERDTTTPEAMLANMQKILLGDVLTAPSRQFLLDTMSRSTTGLKRLKAGLPKDWRIADKTGTGPNNTYNDIAVIWPPSRAPILVCAYYTQAPAPTAEKTLAAVGRAVAKL